MVVEMFFNILRVEVEQRGVAGDYRRNLALCEAMASKEGQEGIGITALSAAAGERPHDPTR
ncbi:hypothetical protein M5K25_001025 [Dendrobium thyrsiflorum]|uniref:Uncharacterized protein n=1 Tax=Dendrobium thyrsiflorum TaxID=117978 RepID=A0ABD0VVP3_DENTH